MSDTILCEQSAVVETVVYLAVYCYGNPGPAGWAIVWMDEDGRLRDATGTLANSTNNRAELIAAVEALRQFPSQSNLRLVCPSQYLLNYEWSLPEWKQNGWKNAARKPVANSDEWVEFDKIACRRNVSLVEKSNDPRSLTPYARQLAKDKCKEIKT